MLTRRQPPEPAEFASPTADGFYVGFEPDPVLRERLWAPAAPVLLAPGEYDIWPTCTAVRELAAHVDRTAPTAPAAAATHLSRLGDDRAGYLAGQGV
jgi:hypothetical protein